MRQAGELDLQLKEMEVVEIFLNTDFFSTYIQNTLSKDLFLFTFQEDLRSAHNSLGKMEREVGQVQVEKEWLISQQKKSAGTSEKAGELAVQLDQVKTELREEKTKVGSVGENLG